MTSTVLPRPGASVVREQHPGHGRWPTCRTGYARVIDGRDRLPLRLVAPRHLAGVFVGLAAFCRFGDMCHGRFEILEVCRPREFDPCTFSALSVRVAMD